MKKLCLAISFLTLVFLLFSSPIFAQHSTCGSGLPWVYCRTYKCDDQVTEVKEECCPSCDSPDFCRDVPNCPEYSADCTGTDTSTCGAPDCYGGYCATMECINNECISDCVPCEDNGPTPTPTPVTPCTGITYMLSPSPPVLENTTVTVNISRIGATNCFGNWNWVGLLLDGVPQGLGLCYADGTNCAQGYHSYINSDGVGTHTLQFTVNSGSCPCNPYSFNTLPAPTADAWFQTKDGDVHAQTNIYDPIPNTVPVAERYCSLLGDGGYPGVVSYGTAGGYDFSAEPGKGEGRVSPEGWLANSSYLGTTYGYEYFDGLIDDDDGDPVLADGKPTSGIYKISGDQSVTSNWSVGSNQSYVFLIDNGKLTINGNINVALGGFIAFIVDGDIEISESVTSLQGVYIANGEIETSGQNNTQLSAKGMFIGWEKVPLNRKFVDESLNNTLPVETFTFRPDLWMNAPKELLKSSYTWQELAP